MAHYDGCCDGTEKSSSQQDNGNPIEHDEGSMSIIYSNKTDVNSDGEKSWIVLQAEDTSVEIGQIDSCPCFIESNEDYSSGDCLRSQNSTLGPLSSGLNALSMIENESFPTEVKDERTEVKEVVDFNAQEEQGTDNGHNAFAPSDLSSSIGSASVGSAQPDYHCDTCEFIESRLPSPDSIDFWRQVPRKGLDETGCHIKFLEKFLETLEKFSKDEKLFADTKVINLLKTLLKVDLADPTAVVEYKNFARLVKFLGPVRPSDCVLVQQIRSIKEASITKDKRRKEKLSWFAGEMTREKAEGLLTAKRSGTYLVRMSQTSVGSFVISVKNEEQVEHVEILGDYRKAVTTDPYNAMLSLNRNTYTSLAEAVNSLKTTPLTIIEDAEEEEEDGVREDGVREEDDTTEIGARGSVDVFCRYCCPDSPLNGVISGYKKTSSRR